MRIRMPKSKPVGERVGDLVTGRDGPTDPNFHGGGGGGDGGGAGDGSGVVIKKPTSQDVNVSKPIPDLRPADGGALDGGKPGAAIKPPTGSVITTTTKKRK
jgi:hypothetical protein